jgi:hypothetical protein
VPIQQECDAIGIPYDKKRCLDCTKNNEVHYNVSQGPFAYTAIQIPFITVLLFSHLFTSVLSTILIILHRMRRCLSRLQMGVDADRHLLLTSNEAASSSLRPHNYYSQQ